MFGGGKTYFADSPVVITVSDLEWGDPVTSPFTIVRIRVIYQGNKVGDFHVDTGGQTSISFEISSALKAIWSDYDFQQEVMAAGRAVESESPAASFVAETDNKDFFNDQPGVRKYREYSIEVLTEYIDSTDGRFVQTSSKVFAGGRCAIGGFTEWERSIIEDPSEADVSQLEGSNARNGDGSTKPSGPDSAPERVGQNSITSWVDVNGHGTKSVFYPAVAEVSPDVMSAHAPIVLRDSQEYVDFLFLNRRGAIETCSALTMEAMDISAEVQQYAHVEQPSFKPSRSLTAIGADGRRSWQMSSGYVSREWAEWWVMEFLGGKRKQWWMRYPLGERNGRYVPVVVKPAKNSIGIYDRTKQQMAHVDFTVTLGLEG